MFEELEVVLAWTRPLLSDRAVAAEEGYYSKLSFLRDVVADGRVERDPSAGVLD